MMKIIRRYLILSFLLLFLTFCSENITESVPSIDETDEMEEIAPTFTDIQQSIFNQSCALSGCHVSGSVNPDLSGNAYPNIVNKSSSTGMNYITPDDPDNSYLLLKVLGGNGISGSRMPINSSPLSEEKINALTQWINDGAQNN